MKQIKVKIKENPKSTPNENEMCKIILISSNGEEFEIYNKYIHHFEISGITENIFKGHTYKPTTRYKRCDYFELELYPEADDLYCENGYSLFQRLKMFHDIVSFKVIFADNGIIVKEYIELPCCESDFPNDKLMFERIVCCNNFRMVAKN